MCQLGKGIDISYLAEEFGAEREFSIDCCTDMMISENYGITLLVRPIMKRVLHYVSTCLPKITNNHTFVKECRMHN